MRTDTRPTQLPLLTIMLETQPLLGGPIKDSAKTVLIVASVVALVVGVIIGTFSSFNSHHSILFKSDGICMVYVV